MDRKLAKDKGSVYYKLVGDGCKAVDRDMPILYITPDGDKVDISDEIEDRHPKPTPWVCIEGVEKMFSENDVKDELRRSLQGGTESDDTNGVGIVDVQRWNDGRLFVKFSKVWDARGCEFVLDGTKKLFSGSEIGVACVLENDLPDTLKMSEARKRDAVSAAKKAKKAAASKLAMEIDEDRSISNRSTVSLYNFQLSAELYLRTSGRLVLMTPPPPPPPPRLSPSWTWKYLFACRDRPKPMDGVGRAL